MNYYHRIIFAVKENLSFSQFYKKVEEYLIKVLNEGYVSNYEYNQTFKMYSVMITFSSSQNLTRTDIEKIKEEINNLESLILNDNNSQRMFYQLNYYLDLI